MNAINHVNVGNVGMSGNRSFNIARIGDEKPVVGLTRDALLTRLLKEARPNGISSEADRYRLRNLRHALRGVPRILAAQAAGAPTFTGIVSAKVFRGSETDECGRIISFREALDLGLISARVITDTGVAYIVDAFQNLVELENMKYHGFGTGTNAEAAGNTALQTELTTQYATDNTRPTGSTVEGATGNIFRTIGTLSPDASVAITEHGIFSATSSGVLLDRSVFSAINLVSGDSLQITYDLTLTSGS